MGPDQMRKEEQRTNSVTCMQALSLGRKKKKRERERRNKKEVLNQPLPAYSKIYVSGKSLLSVDRVNQRRFYH
jgi:hypothetical protein